METEAHRLGMHEKLELHELLSFKTVCLTKSKTLQTLVSDKNLKLVLQKDVDTSTRQIEQLREMLAQDAQHVH